MPDPSSKLWLLQVDSDLTAAGRLWDESDHRMYCQVISKYQQAVEKSVKAIVAAIKEFGIGLPPIGYSHQLDKHLSILGKLPQPTAGLQQSVDGLLTRYYRNEIAVISTLAPKKPAPGQIHALNTEYPFETAANVWVAPCQLNIFSTRQVNRWKLLAQYLYRGACKLVSALNI